LPASTGTERAQCDVTSAFEPISLKKSACDRGAPKPQRERFGVAPEHRLKRLLVLPFRVLRRHRLDTVEGEGALHRQWLLAPRRAVVVERGDELGRRHIVGAALACDVADEVNDRLPRAVTPPRQRAGCLRKSAAAIEPRGSKRSQQGSTVDGDHGTLRVPELIFVRTRLL
jgi:hypothetical protein